MPRFPILLSPVERGRVRLQTRTVFPAHQTLFSREGRVSDRLRSYYVERARGGVGAVVVEGGAVHPTTVKFPDYLRFHDPDVVPSVRALVEALGRHGTRTYVQLAHSGSRMGTMDSREPLWAPSDVRSANSLEVPHAMTRDEITELLRGYRESAELMAEAGVDGIEVHAAHEYLLGEFLSPHNNRRSDEYGGDLGSRARLLIEAVTAVREAVGGETVVGVRMNGDDHRADGNGRDEYVEVARLLEASTDLDYISVSAATSAANDRIVPPMDVEQGVNVGDAAAIREVVDVPVFTVGRIKRPEHAEEILRRGRADVVALARALIADPWFLRKAAEAPGTIRPCVGANDGCYGRLVRVRPISCVVNPAVGREEELGHGTETMPDTPRDVVVVGGGPAGLETARVAAARGHRVILLERSDQLGGQLRLATRNPHRRELWELVAFLEREVARLGVDVQLGRAADESSLVGLAPDAVVVATGSRPRPLSLPGAGDGVLSIPEALARTEDDLTGVRVVVIDDVGHMPAYAPAELLADAGADVAVVTGLPVPGAAMEETTQGRTLRRLASKGVTLAPGRAPVSIGPGGVRVRDIWSGEEGDMEADLVVAAIGNVVDDELHAALASTDRPFGLHAVGDAVAPRTALEAVRDGHMVGRSL